MANTLEQLKKSKTKVAADQDQILDVAHELENLTKEKAEALAYELSNNEGQNEFRLGGVFSVIKSNGWFEGFKDFKAYVSEKFGIEYRKAQYCINIYDKLVSEQISWSKVSSLNSWTKVCILVPVLTAENVEEWVAKAADVNCDTLKALVKAATTAGAPEEEDVPITSEVVKMAFTVHPDQKVTIIQAIEKAKGEVNTEHSTVALENICLGYLSGSVQANKPVGTLKEQMKAVGFNQVLAIFGTLWPEIELEIGLDKVDDNGDALKAA
jgi:hypothetical protein